MSEVTDVELERVINAAVDARRHAYVPYSGFDSGAAVLSRDGRTYAGSLVENLVFGLAMCAERAAFFHAVSHGAGPLVALALAAPTTAGDATFPCGPCLQVAIELGGPDLLVISVHGSDSTHTLTTVQDLAPGIPRRRNVLR